MATEAVQLQIGVQVIEGLPQEAQEVTVLQQEQHLERTVIADLQTEALVTEVQVLDLQAGAQDIEVQVEAQEVREVLGARADQADHLEEDLPVDAAADDVTKSKHIYNNLKNIL